MIFNDEDTPIVRTKNGDTPPHGIQKWTRWQMFFFFLGLAMMTAGVLVWFVSSVEIQQ